MPLGSAKSWQPGYCPGRSELLCCTIQLSCHPSSRVGSYVQQLCTGGGTPLNVSFVLHLAQSVCGMCPLHTCATKVLWFVAVPAAVIVTTIAPVKESMRVISLVGIRTASFAQLQCRHVLLAFLCDEILSAKSDLCGQAETMCCGWYDLVRCGTYKVISCRYLCGHNALDFV